MNTQTISVTSDWTGIKPASDSNKNYTIGGNG